MQTLLELEGGQFVFVNKLPQAVSVSEADKVATALYIKSIIKVSGRDKISTVRDNTLPISKNRTENIIRNHCATRVPGLEQSRHVDAKKHNIWENQPLPKTTEKPQTAYFEYAVDIIILQVTQDDGKKYVMRWCGHPREEGAIEPLNTY